MSKCYKALIYIFNENQNSYRNIRKSLYLHQILKYSRIGMVYADNQTKENRQLSDCVTKSKSGQAGSLNGVKDWQYPL